MTLDVDPPEPPTLVPVGTEDGGTGADDDYLREQIQSHLEAGAWEEAFSQWADTTDMDVDEFAIAIDLDLFERFDFFWDEFAQRVGYGAPGIPEDWKERQYHDDLATWGQVSSINASMTELGQIVCDILKDDYLDVESSESDDSIDLPDFER